MSLYNLVCGMNANLAAVLSVVLGFRLDEKFPRFRDVFTEAGDAPFKADAFVYTRMGGGNRECWDDCSDANPCPACRCSALEREGWVVGSWDDDFDDTYRTFGIRMDDSQRAEWETIKGGNPPANFKERLFALFPKLSEKAEGSK